MNTSTKVLGTGAWSVDVWGDRQWTCIQLNDGVSRATLSLTYHEAHALAIKLLGHFAEELETTGMMLSRYADDCFPPPNEQGQVHFGRAVMDSAALTVLALFHPVRELCEHEWDEQAGACLKCGADVEYRAALTSSQRNDG